MEIAPRMEAMNCRVLLDEALGYLVGGSCCQLRMTSFPLYAETYKIGNLVPAKRERQLSGDDAVTAVPGQNLCDSDPRVSFDGGKYTAEIYVPSAFYGKLIGTRGTTRRELEESTECRLTIPRKGQKGNVEIKSFVGLENVQRCLDRIELLVAEARKT
ncbi:KH domain protein, partial [Ostertagia ostertagi]